MTLQEKFEQLANGGKLRLAYRKHEVHIFKEYYSELCGIMICVPRPDLELKKYAGVTLKGDTTTNSYLLTMTEADSNLFIFSVLIEFVLERIIRIENVDFETLQGIIEEWRDFTRGESITLPVSTQIGLFGELLFLKELIDKVGDDFAVTSWTGPEKSKVDFTMSSRHAVEIKSSKDPMSNEVSISSLEQLSSTFEFHFLRRYGLVETLTGETLQHIFGEIYNSLEGYDLKESFRSKVMKFGYNTFIEYQNLLSLEMATIVDYDVNHSGFPKIIPPIHEKITGLNYKINLDAQPKLEESALLSSLDR